jgi:hypothetical protein
VTYRLRRITRLVYLLHDLLFGSSPAPAQRAGPYQDLLRVFNRQSKAYEIVLGAMESLVDSACAGLGNQGQARAPEEVWAGVHNALYALLADDQEIAGVLPDQFKPAAHPLTDVTWLPQAVLGELNRILGTRAEHLSAGLRGGTQGPNMEARSLLLRLDGLESAIIENFLPDIDDPVRRAYAGFEALDAHVFPLELVGGLDEKDVIETVRISPHDAQRGFSRLGLSDKVAGDAFYHFAGFFKRSWRSNDILWGRLDAACQLTELLMVRPRVEAIVADDHWRARVRARFFEAAPDGGIGFRSSLDPKLLFARSGSATHGQVTVWLKRLLSNDPTERAAALEPDEFERMVDLLIEAEQLQIIGDELPNVIADAVTEEVEWNRFRDPKGSFLAAKEQFDPFVASIAAAQKAREQLRNNEAEALDNPDEAPDRPIETRLGRYFHQSYRVGTEELLRDIPTQALLEILAVALLVVRNCVLGLFDDKAGRVRRNPLYRFVLNPDHS